MKYQLIFFKTVQNKMHYATHAHTAAEIIFDRVDADKVNVGLTNFKGDIPTRADTEIAKNYLTEEELNILNRMVSAYLDIAEINALDHHVMTMKDWVNELDTFLKMTKKNILTHAGSVSHEDALRKAHKEYDKYMQNHLTRAEKGLFRHHKRRNKRYRNWQLVNYIVSSRCSYKNPTLDGILLNHIFILVY